MDPQGPRCWQDVSLAARVTVPSVPSHPQEVQGSGLRVELGLKEPGSVLWDWESTRGGWSGHTTGVCVSPNAEVSEEPPGLSWKVQTPLGYAGAFTHAPHPVPQADLAPARTRVCSHMTLELVGVPASVAALAAAEGPLARVGADMALQLARLDRQTNRQTNPSGAMDNIHSGPWREAGPPPPTCLHTPPEARGELKGFPVLSQGQQGAGEHCIWSPAFLLFQSWAAKGT